MVAIAVFLAICIVSSSSAYVLLENDQPQGSITWPSEYYFSGEEIDLVSSHIETFEVWYSAENNKSRIDYYNGVNKVYYVGESDNETGYQYTIFPKATEELKIEITCLEEETAGDHPDFLPDINDLEYSHEENIDGKQVHVWTKEGLVKDIHAEVTLYVYRTDYDFDVPLKEITKTSNVRNGAIETHLIKNFKQFSFIIDVEEVTPRNDTCENAFSADFKTQIEYLHPHNPVHVHKAFTSYKKHHDKTYKTTEHELRKAIFHRNWRRVHAHNRKNSSYTMELNAFADHTQDELKLLTGALPSTKTVSGSMPFPHTSEEIKELAKNLPEHYDMRLDGVLGPVKNQGSCSSCWAFTVASTVEAALSRTNGGRNLDLSEQSLVDCSWGYWNMGCNGGWPHKTYEYVIEHGIPLESQYGGYLEKDGYCNLGNMTDIFKIRGFALVTPHNSEALKVALVKYGAVSITIYASRDMLLYSSGVFYDTTCEGERLNHAVAVVGYGERDGTPYWIVRNSWGEGWGQDGYILMSAVNNNCLVLDAPYYPII